MKFKNLTHNGKKWQHSVRGGSAQTWRREKLVQPILLLYTHLHLFFFCSCKIRGVLPTHRKRALAAAGEFQPGRWEMFAISSSLKQLDRRSLVSWLLRVVMISWICTVCRVAHTGQKVTFDFSTCLFLKCSFFLNRLCFFYQTVLDYRQVDFLSSCFRFLNNVFQGFFVSLLVQTNRR